MFDVIDQEGNPQHPATLDLQEAIASCDALNKLEADKLALSAGAAKQAAAQGLPPVPVYKPRRYFVEQRLIRYPADAAVVIQQAPAKA